MQDMVNQPNICVVGVPEGERIILECPQKDSGQEFKKLIKDTNPHIQEIQ